MCSGDAQLQLGEINISQQFTTIQENINIIQQKLIKVLSSIYYSICVKRFLDAKKLFYKLPFSIFFFKR